MSMVTTEAQQAAQDLQEAAEHLRWRVECITKHGSGDAWFEADVDLRAAIADAYHGNAKSAGDDARWIALMDPQVGLLLADVFDAWVQTARMDLMGRSGGKEILALARHILKDRL